MNHPTTVWYLAQARMDDLNRSLARPHVARAPRPGIVERVSAHLPHRRPATRVVATTGTGLPVGCCA